jgi:hypothetical protein
MARGERSEATEQRLERWGAKHGHAGESIDQIAQEYYQHRLQSPGGRGHGTGTAEHGFSTEQVGDSVVITMRGREPLDKMEKALNRIDRNEYGSRAALVVVDKDGNQQRFFAGAKTSGRQGYSISGMRAALDSGNFAGAIAGGKYEDAIADAVEIQIEVF